MKTINDFKFRAKRQLMKSYPNITNKVLDKVINNYINVVDKAIKEHEIYKKTDTFFVSTHQIAVSLNVTINKKRINMYNWWNTHCPLYKVVRKGSNIEKKLTEISMYYEYQSTVDLLYKEALINSIEDKKEAMQFMYGKLYDEYLQSDFDLVPIDLNSLENYIDYLISVNAKSDQIKEAKRIYVCATVDGGYLKQIKMNSEFGRIYYKGPNLQSCRKETRHAALGNCYEIDVNNSVYAWRYNEIMKLAKENNEKVVLPETLNYLQFKDKIRKELSKILVNTNKFYRESKIKQLFTAISFGAKAVSTPVYIPDGSLLAIHDIIRNKDDRENLLNNPYMKDFIDEQEEITNFIFEVHKDQYKDVDVVLTKAGNVSKSKLLAYMYQHYETDIINKAIEHIDKSKLLLRCHDAIYVRHVGIEDIKDLKLSLLQSNPEISVSKTRIERYNKMDTDLAHHRRIIEQSEAQAQGYKSPICETDEFMTSEQVLRELLKQEESNLKGIQF